MLILLNVYLNPKNTAVHELNIGWAAHQVHHSSEDYNISTALRQSIMQGWFTNIVYIPIAMCGVHPSLFFTHHSINREETEIGGTFGL